MMQMKEQRLSQWIRYLRRNGISLKFDAEYFGQVIIKVAQSIVDETELARHLRSLSQSEIE